MKDKPKLRVGLLLAGPIVPAWVHEAVQQIAGSRYAAITLAAFGNPTQAARGPLLYRLYRRIGNTLFRPRPDAFAPHDLQDILAGTQRIDADLRQDEEGLAHQLADSQLDVLLLLGTERPTGALLKAARHGVWACNGDGEIWRGGHAGFTAVLRRATATAATWRRLASAPQDDKPLISSWSRTHRLSANHNRNNLYWKNAALLLRGLETLHRDGATQPLRPNPSSLVPTKLPHLATDAPPTGLTDFVAMLAGHTRRVLALGLHNLYYRGQWTLLLARDAAQATPPTGFEALIPPADRCWADPFVVIDKGREFLFVEELLFKNKNAHLSVIALDEEGRAQTPVKILERPYHLSYPFVFIWKGTYYMIPETAANRAIEVYTCTQFPHRWEFSHNLMEGVKAADATLYAYAGRWWLWVNLAGGKGLSTRDELFLFHADEPLSQQWTPHPLNPIVSDVHRARPAGRIFERNGTLYRPSQDSSVRYGYALNLNRIEVLTPTAYREVIVEKIEPWEKDLLGIHTWNHAGDLTAIDGKFRRRRL